MRGRAGLPELLRRAEGHKGLLCGEKGGCARPGPVSPRPERAVAPEFHHFPTGHVTCVNDT